MSGTQVLIPKWKMWLLATRPRTLTAAFIPVIIGNTLAWKQLGTLNFEVFCSTLFGALFIQIGTNFVNDASDFEKGADTKDRLGPMRASQSGLFTSREMYMSAALMFLMALFIGWPLIQLHGIWMSLLFCISVILGYAYTCGPYPLAYIGLGDLFVFLFFGLLATVVSTALQMDGFSRLALVAGAQIGFLATLIIAMNNLRDIRQDAIAGKRTLAVRLGETGAKLEVTALIMVAFLLQFFWWQVSFAAFIFPFSLFPFVVQFLKTLWKTTSGRGYAELFVKAAKLHLGFGILLTFGLLVEF